MSLFDKSFCSRNLWIQSWKILMFIFKENFLLCVWNWIAKFFFDPSRNIREKSQNSSIYIKIRIYGFIIGRNIIDKTQYLLQREWVDFSTVLISISTYRPMESLGNADSNIYDHWFGVPTNASIKKNYPARIIPITFGSSTSEVFWTLRRRNTARRIRLYVNTFLVLFDRKGPR